MFPHFPIRFPRAAAGASALAFLLAGPAGFAQATVNIEVPFNLSGLNTALVSPRGVAVAPDGTVYVTDVESSSTGRVLMIAPSGVVGGTSGGPGSLTATVTTLAPAVGGTPVTLKNPNAVAVDSAGHLYIADIAGNQVLEMMSPKTSAAATVLTYPGTETPTALATDASNNLYVADALQHSIYEFVAGTPSKLSITPGSLDPVGLAVDASGNVFFADTSTNEIYKYTAAGGSTAVFLASPSSGSFQFSAAMPGLPVGMGFDPAGSLYVLDSAAMQLWQINAVTPATNYQLAFSASTTAPGSMTVSSIGNLYISDESTPKAVDELFYNHNPVNVGAVNAGTNSPLLNMNFYFYIADTGLTQYQSVQGDNTGELSFTSQSCGTTPGVCTATVKANYSSNMPGVRNGEIGLIDSARSIVAAPVTGISVAGSLALYPGIQNTLSQNTQQLWEPQGAAVTGNGNTFFIADEGGDLSVRPPTYTHGAVYAYTTSGGIPTGTPKVVGTFPTPTAVALDAKGDLFVADYSGFVSMVPPAYDPNTGATSWPGFGTKLTLPGITLYHPMSLAFDIYGNLYIGDMGPLGVTANTVNPGFIVKVPANGGPAVKLNYSVNGVPVVFPDGLATDSYGNLFIADAGDGVTSNGTVDIVPYGSMTASSISFGSFTPINQPSGIAFDAANDLYLADSFNQRILVVPMTYSGTTPTPDTAGITLLGGASGDSGMSATLVTPSSVVVWPWNNSVSFVDTGYQPASGPGSPTQVITLASLNTYVNASKGTATPTAVNVGNTQISFLAPTLTGSSQFSLSGCGSSGTTLDPGLASACTPTVTFTKQGTTSQTAVFTLNGNAAVDFTALGNQINVTGQPNEPIATISGGGSQNGALTGTLTLTNSGSKALHLSAITVTPVYLFGVQLGTVTVTGGSCSAGTAIGPGKSCTITFSLSNLLFGFYAAGYINTVDDSGGVAGTVQSTYVSNI
ncbi:MAG TPA: NHL repeat-containing protein [Acidobacteriaceae bacterium]|nr:NHL repeat-containing protein [Acidobacteriaceae bacterium]